jgi:hypothetical protein
MSNYTTGLECSKALKEEGIEIETEYKWEIAKTEDLWDSTMRSDYEIGGEIFIPAPDLSELSEVFKLLGEKKGWKDNNWGGAEKHSISGRTQEMLNEWQIKYIQLCNIWATTQSQEKCDEFVINLIQK